jgi:hypothetical protein
MTDFLIQVNTLTMREKAEECSECGEEICTICGEHWGECGHPSEMMLDEYEYVLIDDKLYARPYEK